MAGKGPLVLKEPNRRPPPRQRRQGRVAEVAPVQVVQLQQVGLPEPAVAGDAEGGRVEHVLEVERVEDRAAEPVGAAPGEAPLEPANALVPSHPPSDEHARVVAAPVQPAVELVGRPRRSSGRV